MERSLVHPILKCLLILILFAANLSLKAETMSYLDNGQIRIGVDLDHGGTISYLSRSPSGENLINAHDLGRQVQQSYYSGPQPFGDAHPSWKGWPWNPIGTGDAYGHPSKVLKRSNDGKTLYVKSIPMQWALNDVPGECEFETWIALDGNVAHVRNRLRNHRPDKTQYEARDQELPALYTIGTLYRLFTYDGGDPYADAPVSEIKNAGPPWASWRASENWAALLNDDGWGVGMFHAGITSFIGGFAGKPNVGGSKDDSTGYIAPIRQEILDSNIVYEYDYALIVGNLKEIRAYAVSHRPKPEPDFRFSRDRQGWFYRNAVDAGFPLKGCLQVMLDRADPQIFSPNLWRAASDLPRIRLLAAFPASVSKISLYWKTAAEDGFSESREMDLTVKPDGAYHDYVFSLSDNPSYRGVITGFRLDPGPGGAPGESVRIRSFAWIR